MEPPPPRTAPRRLRRNGVRDCFEFGLHGFKLCSPGSPVGTACTPSPLPEALTQLSTRLNSNFLILYRMSRPAACLCLAFPPLPRSTRGERNGGWTLVTVAAWIGSEREFAKSGEKSSVQHSGEWSSVEWSEGGRG